MGLIVFLHAGVVQHRVHPQHHSLAILGLQGAYAKLIDFFVVEVGGAPSLSPLYQTPINRLNPLILVTIDCP